MSFRPVLDQEQLDLLAHLVELERSLPRENRGRFIVAQDLSNTPRFIHTGGPITRGSFEDVEILARNGFVHISLNDRGDSTFFVTPEGFRHYESLRSGGSQPEVVSSEMRSLVASEAFNRLFPRAARKWNQAASLLWSSDSKEQLTAIGHHCREAMQEFADELLQLNRISSLHLPKSSTIARLRQVMEARAQSLGETEMAMLEALVSLWGAVSDLAQRQEHGAAREQRQLVWEDGRRLVFQTLNVLSECGRSLGRVGG